MLPIKAGAELRNEVGTELVTCKFLPKATTGSLKASVVRKIKAAISAT